MIDPVGQIGYSVATTIPSPTATPEEDNVIQNPTVSDQTETPSNGPSDNVDAIQDGDGGAEKTKGVLRLLQAGHFHGVSDVRLRINFHDEIAAMEQEQYAQVAQQGVTQITDAINSQVDTLTENAALDETVSADLSDALEAFDSALAQIVADGTGDAASLTNQIRTQFDNLVLSMQSVLGIQADGETEPSEDGVTPDENADPEQVLAAQLAVEEEPTDTSSQATPTADYQAFIADLISTFETKLQELQKLMADINILPALSEPHGKGAAYDKFVAMYNNLQMPSTPDTPEASVDTNA